MEISEMEDIIMQSLAYDGVIQEECKESEKGPTVIHDTISVQQEAFSVQQKQFQNREDLIGNVQNLASMQGYAISIKKSKKDKFVSIGCDRGGSYRNRNDITMENRKRKTASRLINCPFEVQGRKKVNKPWVLEVINGSHNHKPCVDMSGHPSCRRFSENEASRVKEMSKSGIAARHILSSLRENNPKLLAVSKTVYNMKAKIRKEFLAGRTMIQALFDELGSGGFTYNMEHDTNGNLTHLFFAHPCSIALTQSYSNVFVMDCTYKTNKYKMPLLDIIGVSSFNTSFYSCFAFLRKEEEDDYIWALRMFSKILSVGCQPSVIVSDRELALMKALQVVFPNTANLLCIWHIEKNVLSKCKPHFKEGEDWTAFLSAWTIVVNSPTELEYYETLQNLEAQYKEKMVCVSYIKNTWLPFKEHFVSAWTEKHGHFGNRVSSRAEGAHSMLKKYLQVSSGDFCEVKNKIFLAVENQFQEIKTQLLSEKSRCPHHFCFPFFKELVTRVSVFALDKLLQQYELAKSNGELLPCKNHFVRSMGLPCAHKMRNLENEVLYVDDIHSQWRLDIRSFAEMSSVSNKDHMKELFEELQSKYQEWPIVQKEATQRQLSQLLTSSVPFLHEPQIQVHKGRPSGSKNKKGTSSTTRDPSAFEFVESTRKCSLCKSGGHNSRTCPKKDGDVGVSSQILTLSNEKSLTEFVEYDFS